MFGEIGYLSASGNGQTYKTRISIIFLLNLKYFSPKESSKIFATPTEMVLFKKEVMVMPLEKQSIDLLIGIDLISKGNFYINNGYFSFEIPQFKD